LIFTFTKRISRFNGELLYIERDYSLLYRPHDKNANISIMIGGYTSLDTICETGLITHISGLNPKHIWIPTIAQMPRGVLGNLLVHFDNPPLKGTGIDYNRGWKTFHNLNNNCICVGDCVTVEGDDCVEFANGIVAVLRKNQLVSLWAKVTFLDAE